MTGLELVPEREGPKTKVLKAISSITYEIEIPIHANINPWDVKVHFVTGWSKLHTPKAKKPTRKMEFKAGDEEKDIF